MFKPQPTSLPTTDRSSHSRGDTADHKALHTFHGSEWKNLAKFMGVDQPELPIAVVVCQDTARPGYTSIDATEFKDSPAVLEAKIEMIAKKLVAAQSAVVYAGAGLSTAAGIDDYATKASDSVGRPGFAVSPLAAEPTVAHHALAAAHQVGLLHLGILQQNHDGLPQKAGMPQEAVNEIHGALFDPSNPVVKMSGQLRSDLFESMLKIERDADICLAVGTSLSGMNADRVPAAVARRYTKGSGHGLVLINFQRTRLDEQCAIRVWGMLDDVMGRIVDRAIALRCASTHPSDKKRIPILTGEHALASCVEAAAEECARHSSNTAMLPYGINGNKLDAGVAPRMLDLSEDAEIVVTTGPYAGSTGIVRGRDRSGNFDLTVRVAINKKGFKAPVPMKLGRWWLDAGRRGAVQTFPIANLDKSL